MEETLYKYFNCKNKEELYTKVKKRDNSVRELLDYFTYVKEDLAREFSNGKEIIKKAEDLKNYLARGNTPNKGEISIIIFDNGNRVLRDFKGNKEISDIEFIKNSHSKLGVTFIAVNNDCPAAKVNSIKEIYKELDIENLDILEIKDNKTVFSFLANDFLNWNLKEEYFNRKKNLINYETKEEQGKTVVNLKGYNEFLEYYTKKELKNLNIILDEEKINEILSLKNQHLIQENIAVIEYDKEYSIKNFEIKFVGGIDKASIDFKVLAPNFFNEKTEGFIILHNHPSGNQRASRADIEITQKIDSLCKTFNKTLYDHLIFSKKGVYSFRKENLLDDISEHVKSTDKFKKIAEKRTKIKYNDLNKDIIGQELKAIPKKKKTKEENER